MRIISGSHKSRRINPPKNLPVRPTTDLAKESLFNILTSYYDIENLDILDLFSGTGNISFEFASRNANEVTAVEINFKCARFIKSTAIQLDFKNIRVIKRDVFDFLQKTDKTFDFIFADPPYDLDGIEKIPQLVFCNNLLNKDGWLIVEHSKETKLDDHPNFLQNRKYSKVNFSIFCHQSEK
ncbi:MAG: 16S rRNA (guanine(966)-N(2))-methyltransferase RsmD [Bacteroidales bacterium]|nr:16S rRNA (guanine(966)-N(2))-methyltransferase RsmD [Bacteroidales bacterium]